MWYLLIIFFFYTGHPIFGCVAIADRLLITILQTMINNKR